MLRLYKSCVRPNNKWFVAGPLSVWPLGAGSGLPAAPRLPGHHLRHVHHPALQVSRVRWRCIIHVRSINCYELIKGAVIIKQYKMINIVMIIITVIINIVIFIIMIEISNIPDHFKKKLHCQSFILLSLGALCCSVV